MTTWGIVSTVKAPVEDILRFAAWHLSQGAHRLYLYLDDANEAAFVALNDHPQITAIVTDEIWWSKRGQRPEKHQVRQTRNATHCYRRLAQVDWLAHIDVDEFLVPATAMDDILIALPPDVQSVRIRPMEQLAGDPTLFKRFIPSGGGRHRIVEDIYPTFGPYLKGGFLSHLAGKVIARTGHKDLSFRIHNVVLGKEMNPGITELSDIDLAHAHAKSWDAFLAAFTFRLNKGSYRAELAPERARDRGGLTLHELFGTLYEDSGQDGLRQFFDEVCAATPDLIAALAERDLLARVDLQLDMHMQKHFPEYRQDHP